MKSEDLISVLKASGVSIINEKAFGELDENLDLVRNVQFKNNYDGALYNILWFGNLMTLTADGLSLEIVFDSIEHSGTWPNHHAKNLQMRCLGDCVGVIGLGKYPHLEAVKKPMQQV